MLLGRRFFFWEEAMKKYSKEECIRLLQEAQLRLKEEGTRDLVSRKEFSTEEVVAIKAFLGPWPRALEAAGIKPPKENSRKDLNRQRRIRSKRRQREEPRAAQRPNEGGETMFVEDSNDETNS